MAAKVVPVLALVVAAGLLPGMAARGADESLFATFQAICLAHNGAADPAAAAADARGWMAVPENMFPMPSQGAFTLQSKTIRLHTDAQALELMLAGRGVFGAAAQGLPADICAVAAKPGDPGVADTVRRWAAVPVQSVAGGEFYPFLDEPTGHVPVRPAPSTIRDAAAGGRFRMVGVRVDPSGLVMLMYVVAKGSTI